MIITIDGPAGTGKSTVAKLLAKKLGFVFFDTGAMYRAVTYQLLKEGIDFSDADNVKKLLDDFDFRIETHAGEKLYFIGNIDVSEEIRKQNVTKHVSEISALQCVRESLVDLQRRFARQTNSVFEGRDLGSIVFPDAFLKIYLTASADVRAERRFREFVLNHPSDAENMTKQQVYDDLLRRDAIDSSRKHSPLVVPDNASVIDTSDLSIEEVIQKIFLIYQELLKE
jgi:cytidylate kinase